MSNNKYHRNIIYNRNENENNISFNNANDFNNAIQLDSEFDQHLASMKKHILILQDKKGSFFFKK
jgi:hypothetical protein